MKKPHFLAALCTLLVLGGCSEDALVINQHFFKTYENIPANMYSADAVATQDGYVLIAIKNNTWNNTIMLFHIDDEGNADTTWKYNQYSGSENGKEQCIALHPFSLLTDKAGQVGFATYFRNIPDNVWYGKIEWVNINGEMDSCGVLSRCTKWNIPYSTTVRPAQSFGNSRPALAFYQHADTVKCLSIDVQNLGGTGTMLINNFNRQGDSLSLTSLSSTNIIHPDASYNADDVDLRWVIPETATAEPQMMAYDGYHSLYFSTNFNYYNIGRPEAGPTFATIIKVVPAIDGSKQDTSKIIAYYQYSTVYDRIHGFLFEDDSTASPLMLYSWDNKIGLGHPSDQSKIPDQEIIFPSLDYRTPLKLLQSADKKCFYVLGTEIGGGVAVYRYNQHHYDAPVFKITHGAGYNLEFANAHILANGDLLICGTTTQFGVNAKPFLMRISGEDGSL